MIEFPASFVHHLHTQSVLWSFSYPHSFNTDYSKESTVNSRQSPFLCLASGTAAKHPMGLAPTVQNSITISKLSSYPDLYSFIYYKGGVGGVGGLLGAAGHDSWHQCSVDQNHRANTYRQGTPSASRPKQSEPDLREFGGWEDAGETRTGSGGKPTRGAIRGPLCRVSM